jgi:proline racemase
MHLGDAALSIETTDYHTAGGPFRIVPGFSDRLRGRTVLDKQRCARDELDHVRRVLTHEPRGHLAMDGAFVTEPVDSGGNFGLVFFEAGGYSSACGHGTIAAVTWALETGLVKPSGPVSSVVVDVPSGRIQATAAVEDGRVRSVSFENVASFVVSEQLAIETSRGPLEAAIGFGGAFYVSIDAAQLGGELSPRALPELVALSREVKANLPGEEALSHPDDARIAGIYGVTFFLDAGDGPLTQRNVTVFGDGVVDRSPCGSGTSARLALLHRAGRLKVGEWMVSRSVIGTQFRASIARVTEVGAQPAVIPVLEGSAYVTGFHEFVLRADDPLPEGFLLDY